MWSLCIAEIISPTKPDEINALRKFSTVLKIKDFKVLCHLRTDCAANFLSLCTNQK